MNLNELPSNETIQSWLDQGQGVDEITKRLVGFVEPILRSRFPSIIPTPIIPLRKDALLVGVSQLHRTVGLWKKGYTVNIEELCQRIRAYHALWVYERQASHHGIRIWLSKKDVPKPSLSQFAAYELGLYSTPRRDEAEIRFLVEKEHPDFDEHSINNFVWRIQNSWNYFVTKEEHETAEKRLEELLSWSMSVFEKTLEYEESERNATTDLMTRPELRKILSTISEVEQEEIQGFTEEELASLYDSNPSIH